MLLDGSYLRDVEKVLDALKIVRRGLIREGLVQVCFQFSPFDVILLWCHLYFLPLPISRTLQVHEQVTQFVLSAATIPSFGLKSVQKYIQKRFPRVRFFGIYYIFGCIL